MSNGTIFVYCLGTWPSYSADLLSLGLVGPVGAVGGRICKELILIMMVHVPL